MRVHDLTIGVFAFPLGCLAGWQTEKLRMTLEAALVAGAVFALGCVLVLNGENPFVSRNAWRAFLSLGVAALLPFLAGQALAHWGQSRRRAEPARLVQVADELPKTCECP